MSVLQVGPIKVGIEKRSTLLIKSTRLCPENQVLGSPPMNAGCGLQVVKTAIEVGWGGTKKIKMPQIFSTVFKLAFFLIQHSLNYCKSLTIVQSSGKVGFDNFCLFSIFLLRDRSLEMPVLLFC